MLGGQRGEKYKKQKLYQLFSLFLNLYFCIFFMYSFKIFHFSLGGEFLKVGAPVSGKTKNFP